jgi:hypothetical protein
MPHSNMTKQTEDLTFIGRWKLYKDHPSFEVLDGKKKKILLLSLLIK